MDTSSESFSEESEASRSELYAFWDGQPKLLFLDISDEVIKSHPSREAVLKILRDGIEEDIGGEKTRVRRALSAYEIQERLEQEHNIDVSKTGMYFHLNKLEEAGLIEVVTKILEGRHKVAYYGRPAHYIIVSDPESRLQGYQKRFNSLFKFLEEVSPDAEIPDSKEFAREFYETMRKREKYLGNKLVEFDDIIRGLGLELSIIFEALKILDWQSPAYSEVLGEVFKAIESKSLL